MIRVSSWEDNDVLSKEVRSCDNHDVGEVQEMNTEFIFTKKGNRLIKIPRSSVATFDGDRLYLRATEAEVYAGIYPFTSSYTERGTETLEPEGRRTPTLSGET